MTGSNQDMLYAWKKQMQYATVYVSLKAKRNQAVIEVVCGETAAVRLQKQSGPSQR